MCDGEHGPSGGKQVFALKQLHARQSACLAAPATREGGGMTRPQNKDGIAVKDRAAELWEIILPRIGVDPACLQKKRADCPLCDAEKAFLFHNTHSRGEFHCFRCGRGSGLEVVIRFTGLSYKDAARLVEARCYGAALEHARLSKLRVAGDAPPAHSQSNPRSHIHGSENPAIRDRARGLWRQILPQLGVLASCLTGELCACPICKRPDSFRFENRNNGGGYSCTHCDCRGGDGMQLVRKLTGFEWDAAEYRVESICRRIEKKAGSDTIVG